MRLLHTMIRVLDLEKTKEFYTKYLGMKVLRQYDNEEYRYTNAFIGYGPEDSHTVLELTYNWDQKEPYDKGEAWGHLAVEVDDVYKTCEELEKAGVSIPRPAGPVKGGKTLIAFIEDPDGYKIELIQRD